MGGVVVWQSRRAGLGGRKVARWCWKALWFGEDLPRDPWGAGLNEGALVAPRLGGLGVEVGDRSVRCGPGPGRKEPH